MAEDDQPGTGEEPPAGSSGGPGEQDRPDAPDSARDDADVTATRPAATLLPSTPPDVGGDDDSDDESGWLIRNPAWAAVIAVLVGVVIGLGIGYLVWDEDDDSVATSDETETDDSEVAELEASNESLAAENESLTAQLSASQREAQQLNDRLDQMVGDLSSNVVIIGDFVGESADNAVAAAEEQGWLVTVTDAETDQSAPGTVIAQAPAAGAPMVQGSAVVLTVAVEPTPDVPDVDLEYTSVAVFQGQGDQTTDEVTLPTTAAGVIRVAYQFQGDSQFKVDVIDPAGTVVATIVDVAGTAAEATTGVADVPFAGTVAFQVTTDTQVSWQLDLQALLPQTAPTTTTAG